MPARVTLALPACVKCVESIPPLETHLQPAALVGDGLMLRTTCRLKTDDACGWLSGVLTEAGSRKASVSCTGAELAVAGHGRRMHTVAVLLCQRTGATRP